MHEQKTDIPFVWISGITGVFDRLKLGILNRTRCACISCLFVHWAGNRFGEEKKNKLNLVDLNRPGTTFFRLVFLHMMLKTIEVLVCSTRRPLRSVPKVGTCNVFF